MAGDYLSFIKELPRSFSEIGAMLPSSRFLGRHMVRPIRQASHPLRILEVGPGTGPFTRQIIELLRPNDEFVICEVNPRFLERLKSSLRSLSGYERNSERIHFFQGPVQELPQEFLGGGFDVIVSSLPLANFSPADVEAIFSLFEGLLAEGGCITFFEYVGVRKIGIPFRSPSGSQRVRQVDQVVKKWCAQAQVSGSIRRNVSFLNLPPAISIELQLH